MTCIIAFPNHADGSSVYTATLSGGSWSTELPLANLQTRLLSQVARSSDATLASTQFDIDLGVLRPILVIAIPKHNLSSAALARIRASNTAGDFASPVYDSGWFDVWPVIYPDEAVYWGHPSMWSRKLSPEDAAFYPVPLLNLVAGGPKIARYWRFELDDDGNDDGHVDLARLFMAPGWQPSENMGVGAELGAETDTTFERSAGGVDYFDRKPARRVVRFELPAIDEEEAVTQVLDMQRRLGIDGECFFVFDGGDTAQLHRRAFLARHSKLHPHRYPYLGRVAVPLELEEVI
jgi:hypothetical protein